MLALAHKQNIEAMMSVIEGKKLIIFGAGYNTIKFINKYPKLHIKYICDNDTNKIGKLLMGIRVMNPRELNNEDVEKIILFIIADKYIEILNDDTVKRIKNIFVFNLLDCEYSYENEYLSNHQSDIDMTVSLLYDELSKNIMRRLCEKRSSADKYCSDIYSPLKYFLPEMFENYICKDEIIIDAGGYIGDTLIEFLQFYNNTIRKIYVFEPLKDYVTNIQNIAKYYNEKNVIVNPLGLSYKKSEANINFMHEFLASSFIDDVDNYTIERSHKKTFAIKTNSLDSIIPENEKVTFIKMDIEGSEYKALLGAKRILKTDKPRLAISIYHSVFDLINIPILVKSIVSEYKMFIRHHSMNWNETILYAFV